VTPLWEATEETLARTGLPPPYWAFAWAGGQALARYLLDRSAIVAGRRVLFCGAGSGLVAIGAARAGADSAAAEIDPFAVAAIRLNAGLNGIAVGIEESDVIGTPGRWEIVLAGDMCYERPLAERLTAWLRRLAAAGRLVLLGDPGRSYLPRSGLAALARYHVPTSRELEDRDSREATVSRVLAEV
jgi:predicted nicotinamide N-methyase